MRDKGIPKIGSHVKNSYKKIRITVNERIGSREKAISQSHICESQIKRPHITRPTCTSKMASSIIFSYTQTHTHFLLQDKGTHSQFFSPSLMLTRSVSCLNLSKEL